jgi:predicted transcriptional regulator
MLINELILSQVPVLKTTDTKSFANSIFEECRLAQLPVLENEKLIGLISDSDLEEVDDNDTILILSDNLLNVFVYPDQHLTEGLKKISSNRLDLLPVILPDSMEYVGSVIQSQFIQATNTYMNTAAGGAVIVLEMNPHQYSFGELCRLVETNDAYITQLNTYLHASTGMLAVSIKINKSEVSDIISTLQRYEYNVKCFFGDEQYANELRENYNQLMSYLNM